MRKPRNFREAAQASLEERWLPISKAKTIYKMRKLYTGSNCALCILQEERYKHSKNPNPFRCGCCPLYEPKSHEVCCKEWRDWRFAVTIGNGGLFSQSYMLNCARDAANRLCAHLERIAEGKNRIIGYDAETEYEI